MGADSKCHAKVSVRACDQWGLLDLMVKLKEEKGKVFKLLA
jgi:hypothetical protein